MQDIENRIKKILELRESGRLNGYAVGVYHAGSMTFIYNGESSLENNIPISKSTKFHIASLTKHITATIFREVEKKGLINADDLLFKHFPSCHIKNRKITLEQLINHTSGIRDQWELAQLGGWRDHDSITNNDIVDLFNRQEDLNFSPKSNYAYCNTGYTLLSIILEKVTGKDIRQLVTEYFSDKFSLTSLNYYSYNDVIPDLAVPYQLVKASHSDYKISKPNFDVTGSTSMLATIEDLILIEKNVHEGNHFNIGAIDEANVVTYKNGLINYKSENLLIQMHSGWDYGYSAFLLRNITSKTSVLILSNYGVPNLFPYALTIAALFDNNLNEDLILKLNINGKAEKQEIKNGSTVGYYLNKEANIILHLSQDDIVTLQGNALLQIDETKFLIKNSLILIEFKDQNSFDYNLYEHTLSFTKIALKQSCSNLSQYLGTYYSKELNVNYKCYAKGDNIYLEGPRSVIYEFKQIDDQYFVSKDYTLTFLSNGGSISGFTLSNFRVWNISFVKILD